MKKNLIIFVCILISSCAANRYPNWEQVRLSMAEPSAEFCVYKVQEVCHAPEVFSKKSQYFEGCYNWYKKRSTLFEANTVFIQREQMGTIDGVASYYRCNNLSKE